MIHRDAKVAVHYPPLKRIDFGLKPRAPQPPELEHVKAARELCERVAYERTWDLLKQSAQGCNPVGGEA